MSRTDIFYTAFRLSTQTAATNIPGFQVIKLCIQYLAYHPHKPISHPSNSYDRSNLIGLTLSGNQVEKYTTHNFLECYQDDGHDIVLIRRLSVSVIIHTILGVVVFWKVHIQPAIAYESTDVEIRYM